MRLDDIDTSGVDAEDQRGSGGRGSGGRGFPMGGGILPLGGGRMGCGTIVIILLLFLLGPKIGIDPWQIIGGGGQGVPVGQSPQPAPAGQSGAQACDVNAASKFSCQVLASANKTWEAAFPAGKYREPKIVFYTRNGQSGCGAAQSAMGPFYCPADQGIYLDTDFYSELSQRFGAAGDFAQAYVIAHEMGHHIQYLTGIADQVRAQQQKLSEANGNKLQVAMELQADCYAGVWAAKNKDRIEPGDIEEGLNAAHQIGDDTLMKAAGRRPVEAAFTHGSSAQRMEWLRRGLETGNEDACDTFSDLKR